LEPSKPGILGINTLYLAKEEFDKLAILEGFEIERKDISFKSTGYLLGLTRSFLMSKNFL